MIFDQDTIPARHQLFNFETENWIISSLENFAAKNLFISNLQLEEI